MNIKFSILHSRVGKSECICIRRKLRRLKKGSDYFSVLNKDQGVIHDICQKKVLRPQFLSQKITPKNATSRHLLIRNNIA